MNPTNFELNNINTVSTIYKIKDSAIFLGVLYVIGFLIMLPLYLYYFGNTISILGILLISLIVIVGVHFLFNWLYYFTIALPLIAAVTFFILGWFVYIFSPVLEIYFNLLLQPFLIVLSLFGINISDAIFKPLFTIIDRVGQFFIVVSGLFWWLVTKGEDIKYKSLAFYLVFLVFIGAILGIGNMTNVFFFLFIWYLLYLKVQGLEENQDIFNFSILFKIGATLVVLSGVAGVEVIGTGLNSMFRFNYGNTNNVLSNLASLYPKILGILVLFGVWNPNVIKKIPRLFEAIQWLEQKAKYMIKWR